MATEQINVVGGKWNLSVSNFAGQTFTKTLKTAGKYVDKDIDITVQIKGGSATTPATTITAAPTVTIDSDGLITAVNSKTQNVTPSVVAGYISSGTAGTITVNGSGTLQLPVIEAATYTPGTEDQTISVSGNTTGFFVKGLQKILGDANLIPANIKSGVSIFGVEGTMNPDSEDYTNAAAAEILQNYEAYDKDGNRLVGTMPNKTGLDLTSSATSGKTMTLTLNSQTGLYVIKMYAGSTGYALKDSTYITDTVAASTLKNGNTAISSGAQIAASGSADQTIKITAGYYPSDRTVVFKKMAAGSATTPATTINVTPELSDTYESGKGYRITVSGSKAVTPTVSAGYVSAGTAGTITVADDGTAYVAQSSLTKGSSAYTSGSTITANTSAAQTVTISAGYYPTARTVVVGKLAVCGITLSASITSNVIQATNELGSAYTIGQSTAPASGSYVKMQPKATAVASAPAANFSAGWLSTKPSDATAADQLGTALYLPVYDGTIE